MKSKIKILAIILILPSLVSCYEKEVNPPLPSWNNTEIKKQIIDYVRVATEEIPEADRIAVFDLDGTLACETPLWFEMAVAVQGMVDQLDKNPELIEFTEYQYAKKLSINPYDKTVLDNWIINDVNYLDSIILKAFVKKDYEKYIEYASNYLSNTKDPKYDIMLADMFYQPMLELIEYMVVNKFTVYVVSGSMQGVIWSVCPQNINLDREHLIGTRQVMTPVYNKEGETSFLIEKAIYQPKNGGDGKSLNIYSHIGKIPVFAFGNTVDDFGMFHLVSTSKYPNIALLLNHDDEREYIHEPYHGTPYPYWKDSVKNNNWVQVDMSKEFKTIWKNNAE